MQGSGRATTRSTGRESAWPRWCTTRRWDEPELLDAVSAGAAIALENGRLHAELPARLEELRGSRARVIEAGQKERQRLERDLHDGAQQRLIALSLELGVLEGRLRDDPVADSPRSGTAGDRHLALEELRDVARGIHPAVVSGHGLAVALEQLAARAPVPVRLTVEIDGRLPEPLEVAAYYLVLESLANIGKHAQATSATVDVGRRTASSSSRSSTTGSAARTPSADRACAVSPTGSRRSTAGSGSGVRWGRDASAGGDPMRVVIAEDSVLLREGLARLLDEDGVDVVGPCETPTTSC